MTDQPKRKKSEKRQREAQIKIRCTRDEFNEAASYAAEVGLSLAAYGRASMLKGNPGIRAKSRLPVDAEILRTVLAQFGKYGNNLNQIARAINEGDPCDLPELRLALRHWGEIRDTILAALNRNPEAQGA